MYTTKYAIALKYFGFENLCSAAVSKNEQLPEDGQVRPKYVAVHCDFNVILN
jgi:hypothetical protein